MKRRLLHILLFTAILMAGVNVYGQTAVPEVWTERSTELKVLDPTLALGSKGSLNNPYLITSPADLEFLRQEYWDNHDSKYDGAYFRQTADIDFQGKIFSPIGYGNSAQINISNASHHCFRGHYDAQGHRIRNMVIDWSLTDFNSKDATWRQYRTTFALFGVMADASLKNLVCENIRVTRVTPPASQTMNYDYRLAIVAGAAYNSEITNVQLLNCRIDDGHDFLAEGQTQDLHPVSLFVGGVVADQSSGFGGYDVNLNKTTRITNVYAQVDFDFPDSKRMNSMADAKRSQFNIGGILGRSRRSGIKAYPKNVYYTGTANAPLATIAPLYGLLRCNADNTTNYDLGNAYMGEVLRANATTTSNYEVLNSATNTSYANLVSDGSTFLPDHNLFFGPYVIHNNVTGTDETITNSYPIIGTTIIRSIGGYTHPHSSGGSGNFDPYSEASMAEFQGVNHGTWVDMESTDDADRVYTMLNTYAVNNNLTPWGYRDGVFTILNRIVIKSERLSPTTFRASLSNGDGTERIRWYGVTPTGEEIEFAPGTYTSGYTSTLTIQYPELYGSIVAKACDNANELILLDGKEIKTAVTIDRPVYTLERDGFNTFTSEISNVYPGAHITVSWEAIDRLTGDHVDLGTGETLTVAAPDIYSSVIGTISALDGTPLIDISGNPLSTNIGINPITLNLVAHSDLEYQATVTPTFADADYTYRWRVADADFNWTELPATTGPDLTLTDSDGYAYVSVTLTDGSGNIIPAFDGTPSISALIEVGSKVNYTLKLTRSTTPSGDVRYIATVYDRSNHVFMGGADGVEQTDYAFHWEVTSDVTNRMGWEDTDITDGQQCYIDPYSPERFYRVTWMRVWDDIVDGVPCRQMQPLLDGVIGDVNVVFVYDKNNSLAGYNLDLTTFDGIDKSLKSPQGEVLGVYYDDGNDANAGYAPYCAVRTMQQAYKLLDPTLRPERNIIVVMGYYHDTNFMASNRASYYRVPATITGERGALLTGGVIRMKSTSSDPHSIANPTIFEHIAFDAHNYNANDPAFDINSINEFFIYCNGYDLTIGEGVKLQYILDVGSSKIGLLSPNAPRSHIVGGFHNPKGTEVIDRSRNADPNFTTININSGVWARVIGSSRNNSYIAASNNIFSTPQNPFRVKINIAITHSENGMADYGKSITGNPYDYDIGLLTGGQTDGSTYSEVVIQVNEGSIGRFISGNISYGRNTAPGYPSDAFFGSTTVTLLGGTIGELFGGSLGRHDCGTTETYSATETCEAYFYGRTIINIDGCTVNHNIYGAGAGGVAGVGDDVHHTDDKFIPYFAPGATEVSYDSYDNIKKAGGTFPVMHFMEDDTDFNLQYTHSEVNIISGTVNGNVYGGGYGFALEVPVDKALSNAGTIFGNTRVTVGGNRATAPAIHGSVFGGSAGSDEYFSRYRNYLINTEGLNAVEATELAMAKYGSLAHVYGDCEVILTRGTIDGTVNGGSQGVDGFENMSTVYGNTSVTVDGAFIDGSVFGGCDYASVRRHTPGDTASGNTSIDFRNGTLGNCLFGGSRGSDSMAADIEGSTYVKVSGGQFINTPFLTSDPEGLEDLRAFNIFGGGYLNGEIGGDTHVDISHGLLTDEGSILPAERNPNRPEAYVNDFDANYRDITFRRFCVYGGGWGENADVLGDTYVDINIPDGAAGFIYPHPNEITALIPGQTFFDIAGGGYGGAVGYWVDANGIRVKDLDDPQPADYVTYINGNTHLTVRGYPFIRKVIGGGFYGTCRNTDTNVLSGALNTVYGGSLLGYVHDRAMLNIGSRPADHADPNDAARFNRLLFILTDVFGGNDVKGIIGTQLFRDRDGSVMREASDNGPLFCADVNPSESKGVVLNIFGGNILGDVYGAGNGHYRGYYVPEWTRYNDGPARHYREVRSSQNPEKPGRVYRSRPMVGSVNMNICGNSKDDRITIGGSVFGGGRSCTIGQWATDLPFEDPRRYLKGGSLRINFGGYTDVLGNLYMGARGDHFTEQSTLPPDIDLNNFNGSLTANLNRLGEIAYDHWYFNVAHQRYEPGFPEPGTVDGNLGMLGQHMYRGYLKNIEMNGDVELTFYRNLYTDGAGNLYDSPAAGRTRRTWLPAELTSGRYDAPDITFNSVFMGGQCGSMTNNNVMAFDYSTLTGAATPELEKASSIYRLTLPFGVTVRNKVVGGSETALNRCYRYSDDFTQLIKEDEHGNDAAMHTFPGGIVTQSAFTFDLICYNDEHGTNLVQSAKELDLPSYPSPYTLKDGTVIYRHELTGLRPDGVPYPTGTNYAMAKTADGRSYIGKREDREGTTAVKLGIGCKFLPINTAETEDPTDHKSHYGGLIYGGCYESGYTVGDVIINTISNLLGDHINSSDPSTWDGLSSLKYNIGRVYGGGFGKETTVVGNTFVNLLTDFTGMNIFGGGHEGSVTGSATINYIGSEYSSFIYGTIYGGGLRGNVGTQGVTRRATKVNLFSGNVDKVYGGSCMGNLYGTAFVRLVDEVTTDLDHLDYSHLIASPLIDDWSGSRLICGTVFGGNDIAGTITLPDAAMLAVNSSEITVNDSGQEQIEDAPEDKMPELTGDTPEDLTYHTTVFIHEVQGDTDPITPHEASASHDPESEDPQAVPGHKDTPGSDNGYNGFPLVGNMYAGSNGNYGLHSNSRFYTDGTVEIATGHGADFEVIELNGGAGPDAQPLEVPHIGNSRLVINGGTVINAFGGGDLSTITDHTDITVYYDLDNLYARAGFRASDDLNRLWNIFHLASNEQLREVLTTDELGNSVFNYQVFRLFGGNDNANMSIQPTWNLHRGYLGSVYSGANFGHMTYFNPTPAPGEHPGLYISVNSPDIHINTLYGGGRVGDVTPDLPLVPSDPSDPASPLVPDTSVLPADYYGATVEIFEGVVDHVFGGNDVAGIITQGTHVIIRGAISGDVYCAGNGNYRYLYDPSLAPDSKVVEEYNDDLGGRYFRLPQLPLFGADNPSKEQRLLAINWWRPNVTKAKMEIAGSSPDNPVYVHGSVYCGGNSSTVIADVTHGQMGDIDLVIGDNVILNNVYMGSNGTDMADSEMLYVTEVLNGLDLTHFNHFGENNEHLPLLDSDDPQNHAAYEAHDKTLYPSLLDLYMRAVEVNGLPNNFQLAPDLTNVYIGNFFAGGNMGSMLTDRTIRLSFPENLVIFGSIVGGSNSAILTYKGTPHVGGLTKPLDPASTDTEKVHLAVHSRFEPWRIHYPVAGDFRQVTLEPDVETVGSNLYFPKGKCMVYGGCYNSGRTVGNITLDIFSDMTAEPTPGSRLARALAPIGIGTTVSKKRVIVNGIDDDSRRSFAVVGAGYGAMTEVYGDTHVRMLPAKAAPGYVDGVTPRHPSVASIFGGSQEGTVIGNSTVEVRDGSVLTNIYAGSESAQLFGSTQTIIGWPEYYRALRSARYSVARADNLSKAATEGWVNQDINGAPVIRTVAAYRQGDIVSSRVVDAVDGLFGINSISPTEYERVVTPIDDMAEYFKLVDNDTPDNFIYNDEPTNITWDDIEINVGDQRSHTDSSAEYFGHGNIYGGGFIASGASLSLAGRNTVCRFDKDHNSDELNPTPDLDKSWSALSPLLSYGGNSTILVWDNPENADLSNDVEADDNADNYFRDHINIGTAYFRPVANLKVGQNIMGTYVWDAAEQQYIHQAPRELTQDDIDTTTFYEVVSDGGIYGGGRKVYVEGMRVCDMANYGYADASPQYPKLLNTFQHFDILSLSDCCLQLQGATDFATNNLDATEYAITRVGELQLHSSLPRNANLDSGMRETSGLYNILHKGRRSRNYLGLFRNVLYLGALTSDCSFDDEYHGSNGELYSIGDWTTGNTDRLDFDDATFPAEFNYRNYKLTRINEYYSVRSDDTATDELKRNRKLLFDQRNIGTAPNMIGINNGHTLRIQGARTLASGDDETYYGPVNGVTEVKLLTLAQNEGGGYIFALNQHDDPNSFLETTGNFVFPGAAYTVSSNIEKSYNYIYDDCFPMGQGFDHYYETGQPGHHLHPRASVVPVEPGHGDTNELQEVHYWYVNGSTFYYSMTLTAYTFNESHPFFLDQQDRLQYLYGVQPGAQFTVKSVFWENSDNIDSDIQHHATASDPGTDYKIFLSVDNLSNLTHSYDTDPANDINTAHSFTAQVPRADFDGTSTADTDVCLSYRNNYSDYSQSEKNTPLIGFTLLDNVDNSDPKYFDKHLREPEKVRITVQANGLNEEGAPTQFTYVFNLSIHYLLGPTIHGAPVIENGALPGEYIFANAFNVDVKMDESTMAVTSRDWYLVPDDPVNYPLTDNTSIGNIIDNIGQPGNAAINLHGEKFDSDLQVHIPAYHYLNGWKLIYAIHANNTDFYLTPLSNPDDRLPHLEEGQEAQEGEEAGTDEEPEPPRLCNKELVVHNYHRMRPYDGTSLNADGTPRLENLKLTEGARVYIEDDDDLRQFFVWLKGVQQPVEDRIDGEFTEDGLPIDPQYGQGITFHLMNDVDMPENLPAGFTNLTFKGVFHGNGHSIVMGDQRRFLARNEGTFFNTGFISTVKTGTEPIIFEVNAANIENCFYYNNDRIWGSLNRRDEPGARLINCFQTSASTSDVDPGFAGLRQMSVAEFNYGEVAYNLNRFYLMKRLDLHTAEDHSYLYQPLTDIYADGDYRFASFDPLGAGTPTALRTRRVPNYHDFRGIRLNYNASNFGPVTGADATAHNVLDLIDTGRVVRDEHRRIVYDAKGRESYLPNFPEDYLFFGQNLAEQASEFAGRDIPGVPTTIDEDNRVYRASGFYGSAVDHGYHFNRYAVAVNPALTAIDFTGYRDAAHGNAYLVEYPEPGYSDQVVYYPPMLDMPDAILPQTEEDELIEPVASFDVADNITRNLIVYRPVSLSVFDDYSYNWGVPEADIVLHPIDAPSPSTQPSTRFFHLVDLNDFNAPIAFAVTDTIWYQRLPERFSSGNNAWDGICLPFTAHRVLSTVSKPGANEVRNHGILSHFYGPYEDKEDPATSHEYWLRKFIECDGSKAYFTRPASQDDVALNPADEKDPDFFYSNDYFSVVFGNYYGDDTTHARPQYTSEGVHYYNYPMITSGMPYIISYPGVKFYEFDLSGEFYASKFSAPEAVKQLITFYTAPKAGDPYVVPVTDLVPVTGISHDGYTMAGTFMHRDYDAYTVGITEEAAGSMLERHSASEQIPPFRTYMTIPSARNVRMLISSRGIEGVGQGNDDSDEQQDPQLTIATFGMELVVSSNYATTLDIYTPVGTLVDSLEILPGENSFTHLPEGIFITAHGKFYLHP